MTIKAVKSIEVRTLRSFHVKLDPVFTNGHDFCELIVDESNNSFTARLYGGETYSYSWGAPGEDFIEFLIGIFSQHEEYLFDKLADLSFNQFIHASQTAQGMKKLLLTARYQRRIEEDDARLLWEEIDDFSHLDDLTESHFYEFYSRKFEVGLEHDIFSSEPWYEDFIVRNEDYKCRIFCEKVGPILGDVLKQEYKKMDESKKDANENEEN